MTPASLIPTGLERQPHVDNLRERRVDLVARDESKVFLSIPAGLGATATIGYTSVSRGLDRTGNSRLFWTVLK